LLKNSVPVSEYVLVSEPIYPYLDADLREHAKKSEEELEGLGSVTTHYVDFTTLSRELAEPVAPSFFRRIWGWMKMTVRSIPYFLGVRRSCDGFRNMGEVDPSLAPIEEPPQSTAALASFQTVAPPKTPD
jgi:hypothetical protein